MANSVKKSGFKNLLQSRMPGSSAEKKSQVAGKSAADDYVMSNKAPLAVRGRRKATDMRWPREDNFYTSVVFNKYQYVLVKNLAYEMRATYAEMLYLLVEEGLNSRKYRDLAAKVKADLESENGNV